MPRRHYIYIPFACDRKIASHQNVWELSERMVKHFVQKDSNEHPHVLYSGAVNDDNKLSARHFGAEDVLYINSHGNQRAIGTENDDVNIDPAQLANRLRDDGLDHNVVHVKVATCSSAKGHDEKKGRRAKTENASFAGAFCAALFRNNYKAATIYGYTGELTTHDEGWNLPFFGLYTTHAYVGDTRAKDPSVRKQFRGEKGKVVNGG